MVAVEALAARDSAIKAIWCVPKYSNPTGAIYADETVDRLAEMETAAPDFRIFWDDAYSVHHLNEARPVVKNVYGACVDAGCPGRPYMFASTSKISIPGAGLSALAASAANVADIARKISFQTIGPDNLNQLRYTRFFKDLAGIDTQMEKHAALIGSKFDAADAALTTHLGGTGLVHWRKPTAVISSVSIFRMAAQKKSSGWRLRRA